MHKSYLILTLAAASVSLNASSKEQKRLNLWATLDWLYHGRQVRENYNWSHKLALSYPLIAGALGAVTICPDLSCTASDFGWAFGVASLATLYSSMLFGRLSEMEAKENKSSVVTPEPMSTADEPVHEEAAAEPQASPESHQPEDIVHHTQMSDTERTLMKDKEAEPKQALTHGDFEAPYEKFKQLSQEVKALEQKTKNSESIPSYVGALEKQEAQKREAWQAELTKAKAEEKAAQVQPIEQPNPQERAEQTKQASLQQTGLRDITDLYENVW